MMTSSETVLYTAKVRSIGGRDGASRSSDGRLDVALSAPGGPGSGTNPEQLLAAGWSACFIGAMGLVARKLKIDLPCDTTCEVEIDLCYHEGAYFLRARHTIGLPGIAPLLARTLVDTAHATCPYSRATRGNISVEITVS
jgi:Ohr subfamily peroxiredoxin